ncbi:ABC transporter ATP-binding protein [Iamia sp.]|uniref:ABC transporter ATP-binding protein n=1 Tax=Iamia sp. TaxID=2722710 RepID=UPI002C42240B|nr:ABC transporter ATP-binding protein [Iamia sp.]HXH58898.1 ABC transporter ATP-binding protein [Iamia sp.]
MSGTAPRSDPVFQIRGLTVDFVGPSGAERAVDGVDLGVRPGETLGVVGESGAGKSVTVLAALRLLPEPPARVVAGQALLDGTDLLTMPSGELRSVRGRDIGMVFQDPFSSLHPSYRVGDQVAEAIRVHDRTVSRSAARARTAELLDLVGVPHPTRRAREYPHQWSGGMRQRAVIAMAIANGPKVLIADEPTTALDVTTQAQVLDVLRTAQRETGAATVLITHDLGVIAEMADRVAVFHDGRVVETATATELFRSPRHEYTAELLSRRAGAIGAPSTTAVLRAPPGPPVLEVEDLVKHFPTGRRATGPAVHAVDGITFTLAPGESLGLVGESGCGKSTLARTVVRLLEPTSGRIRLDGTDITRQGGADLRATRARLRIVFQDPSGSLNPRRRIGDAVAEPLRIHGRHRSDDGRRRALELLDRVGIGAALAHRWPHELSGGQRQRVAIARALALEPRVLVLDEPVSSLDAPVRAQVLDLLDELRSDLGLAYLLISHDLTVVRQVCDRVAVMYLGRFVETGAADAVCTRPEHPYTRALLSAVPVAEPGARAERGRIVLGGDLPDPTDPPSGCRFESRCGQSIARCATVDPSLTHRGTDHECACHLVGAPTGAAP